jgi:hypothetical protein
VVLQLTHSAWKQGVALFACCRVDCAVSNRMRSRGQTYLYWRADFHRVICISGHYRRSCPFAAMQHTCAIQGHRLAGSNDNGLPGRTALL